MKPGKRNISGLYKRGAVWYYRFTMDGVDHDKSTKCRNREDAHKVLLLRGFSARFAA